jgi:DNA-directed RNA polymerase subunit RPC12/RpoP
MPVISCPNCGKPSIASLAKPDAMQCAACGHRGSPPPDVVHSLREAAAIIGRSSVEARQLTDSVKRALASGNSYRRRFTWIFGGCSTPVVLFMLLMVIGAIATKAKDGNGFVLAACFAMIVETVLLGIAGRALLARRQRMMEEACAAHPPSAPGEPTTCHVCGAPLLGHAEAFVRCQFCGADNLVAPAVLARVRGALSPWYGSQSAAVERALANMRDVNRGATVLMMLGALAVPPVMLLQVGILLLVVNSSDPDADPSVQYTVVKTSAGDCIGRIASRAGSTTTVNFGAWKPDKLPMEMQVPTSQIKAFTVTKLNGKRVRTYEGKSGKVIGVLGSPLEGNAVKIPSKTWAPTIAAVTGLCLLQGEKIP